MNIRENQLKCLNAMKEIDSILTNNNIWYSLSYGSVLGAYREHGFIQWDGDIDIMISRPDQERVTDLLKKHLSDDYELISHTTDTVGGYDEIQIHGVSSDDMHIDVYPIIAGPNDKDEAYKYLKYCRMIHRIIGCKTSEINRLTHKWKIPIVILIRIIEYLIPNKLLRNYTDYLMDKYNFTNSTYYFPFSNDGKRGEVMEKSLLFETVRMKFEDILLPVPKKTEEYLRRLYGEDFMIPKVY